MYDEAGKGAGREEGERAASSRRTVRMRRAEALEGRMVCVRESRARTKTGFRRRSSRAFLWRFDGNVGEESKRLETGYSEEMKRERALTGRRTPHGTHVQSGRWMCVS